MSWPFASYLALAVLLGGGFLWYERVNPSARVVALVAALAALAVAGRLVLAPVPNVVGTTDIAVITGFALGAAPGFAVGALAAPISNIWLGQGPWTLWQMGGWGLAGLVGAALAVVFGRRLGRLGLALACAAMGLAYGAILDLSVMVTYGGEQSLDRYLALSVRGIPFNLAHAAGNFAIAYAAGPALIRMIDRYRVRFEFRWHPAGALPVVLAGLVLATAATAAFDTSTARADGIGDGRSWLERAHERSGGYSATPGQDPSARMTGWAMLGLEAAGRNPLDVGPAGRGPVDYLESRAKRLRATNDLELVILALEGAGLDSRRFGGANLVSRLRSAQSSDGSWQGQVNLTAYAILALRSAGESGGIASGASWLRSAQNRDGGWGFGPGQPSDPDSTGSAMQGLAAARSGALGDAIGYLRRTQRSEGGWGINETGVTNSQSTAWAIQGLVAAGVDPAEVKRNGRSGLRYLAARQAADGHYEYRLGAGQTPVWVTSQALLAVSREALPIEPVRRADGSPPAPTPDVAPGAEPPAATDPGKSAGTAKSGASKSAKDKTKDAKREQVRRERRSTQAEQEPAESAAVALGDSPATEAVPGTVAGGGMPDGAKVGAGLGGLALALAGGFLWYRRTLP